MRASLYRVVRSMPAESNRHLALAVRCAVISAACLLVAPSAQAKPRRFDDGYGGKPTEPLKFAFENITATPTRDREWMMEVNVRVRSVSVPRSVLDGWYFDEDNPNWAYIEGRPKIAGLASGFEFVAKTHNANGIFYVEYVDSSMGPGYWDDVEEPEDHLDGDFLAPSKALGLVTGGADYAYESHIVKLDDTAQQFGLSFLVGGGLGVGVITGRLDRWGPDEQGNPSYKRYLDGEPADSGKDVPRVFPMVDVNAGLRFNFGNRAVLRVEGGLHTLLYYGVAAGVTF